MDSDLTVVVDVTELAEFRHELADVSGAALPNGWQFQRRRVVARQGLVIEARTLTRWCYQNLFCAAGLVENGDDFVTLMHDQIRSLRS